MCYNRFVEFIIGKTETMPYLENILLNVIYSTTVDAGKLVDVKT